MSSSSFLFLLSLLATGIGAGSIVVGLATNSPDANTNGMIFIVLASTFRLESKEAERRETQ